MTFSSCTFIVFAKELLFLFDMILVLVLMTCVKIVLLNAQNYGKSKNGNNRMLKTQMVAAAVSRGRSNVGMFVLVVVQIASGLVQI